MTMDWIQPDTVEQADQFINGCLQYEDGLRFSARRHRQSAIEDDSTADLYRDRVVELRALRSMLEREDYSQFRPGGITKEQTS